MKTHLGCCSIKWIHIGFLLVAIRRSYLTTSLQNVCVHATMNDLLRVGVLWKSLWNLRAIPAIHPLVCSHSSENTISTSGLLYLCVFPYTCHIYFIKTQRKWKHPPPSNSSKSRTPSPWYFVDFTSPKLFPCSSFINDFDEVESAFCFNFKISSTLSREVYLENEISFEFLF